MKHWNLSSVNFRRSRWQEYGSRPVSHSISSLLNFLAHFRILMVSTVTWDRDIGPKIILYGIVQYVQRWNYDSIIYRMFLQGLFIQRISTIVENFLPLLFMYLRRIIMKSYFIMLKNLELKNSKRKPTELNMRWIWKFYPVLVMLFSSWHLCYGWLYDHIFLPLKLSVGVHVMTNCHWSQAVTVTILTF